MPVDNVVQNLIQLAPHPLHPPQPRPAQRGRDPRRREQIRRLKPRRHLQRIRHHLQQRLVILAHAPEGGATGDGARQREDLLRQIHGASGRLAQGIHQSV